MSAHAQAWVWDILAGKLGDVEISTTQWAVLIALANFANKENQLWHSYGSIAEFTRMNRRTVMNACQWLEENQFIHIERRKLSSNTNDRNLYTLLIPEYEYKESRAPRPSESDSPLVNDVHPGSESRSLNINKTKIKTKSNPPIVPQGGHASGLERFDEFWDAYQKKVGKKEAMDVWRRKNLDRIADEIIPKARDRASRDPEWLKEGRKFQPQAVRYLRHERWNDEYSTETRHENTSRNTRKQTAADILERERQIIRERAEQERYAQDPTVINGEFFIC